MSGGHFDYHQFHIGEIADNIQKEIDMSENIISINDKGDEDWYVPYYHEHKEETIIEFKKAVILLRKAKIYTQRIDWYLSGDDGEESFHERLKEELSELIDIK